MDLKGRPFHLSDEDIGWVKRTLGAMDLRAKVGQVFCPIGTSMDEDWLKGVLDEFHPGGMLFRPRKGSVIGKANRFLQQNSPIPLLIASNLESGGTGIASDGTLFGSQMQVAATGDVRNAYRLGLVSGREARAVGINWTFSPVVDIDLNFRNPITNTRTYGSDPVTVIEMGKAYMKGMHECGIAVSLKHFPGDGVDERDQHLLTSVNDLPVDAWNASYGRVYRELIEAGAQTIMVAHIMLPAWQRLLRPELADGDLLPASLSPELMTGLLRGKLGFNGLIVSDATTMTGFTMAMKREDAVPACIAAGCDMFLFNIGLKSDFDFLLGGIDRGLLTMERLDEAVTRILALKAALKLHVGREGEVHPPAENDLTVLMHVLGDLESTASHSGGGSTWKKFKALLEARGFEVEIFEMARFDANTLQKPPREQLANYDLVIYYANLGAASNQTVVRPNWITPYGTCTPKFIQEKATLFISVSSPYHLQDVPRIKTFINAYTPSDPILEALVGKLVGDSPFQGKNPVDPFCGLWDAKL
jgi:beta-N-acetylhexosaminidase